MKKIFLFISAVAICFSANAQTPTFSKSDLVFNLGIGLGTSLYSGAYYKSTLPPLSLSVEYGAIEDFLTEDLTLGLGGYVGIAGSKYEANLGYGAGTYGWKYSYTVIGARGALHYPLVEKLDTYAGMMLGYNIVSFKEIGTYKPGFGIENSASSHVAFSIYIGGRYYFSDNFAAMAELGYGIAYLNLGIALKI